MSECIKYQHLERLGTSEVDGITDGLCHVFYKIDGTNASVWMDGLNLCCGSRNRELTADNDNQGFFKWVHENDNMFYKFFAKHPELVLYGEWLVPHSLKTYRDDAWRDFYVFDVVCYAGNNGPDYLSYDVYSTMLSDSGINTIPPIATIEKPSDEDLFRFLEKSGEFLVKDGEGKGEGIVIKNYDFVNRYGRTTWAKIVSNEFKEKHKREMGAPHVGAIAGAEDKIVEKYVTLAFVEKEYAKIESEDGWHSRMIPKLLGVCWHELITEECWNFVKEFKNPKIDFKRLNNTMIRKIKELKGDIF